ncbi:MAG TPA: GvpL/GvpF family gas vesicle protein [Terriglobales bacterium]|nr:GvpL/GvpF family gas vesicle protein [Terriglobales bacterium]
MLLLYCMAEASPNAPLPPRGVRSAAVETLQHGSILCYLSRYESFPGGAGDELMKDALDFHWAINLVFEKTAVFPFRFPTLMKSEEELKQFLATHADAYLADLQRLRGQVQMEIRVTQQPEQIVAENALGTNSGTAYLQRKAAVAQYFAHFEQLIKSAVQAEWKQRANRYFALVPRATVAEFRDKINDLGQASLRVSGPWPPTEFVNCYPEADSHDSE